MEEAPARGYAEENRPEKGENDTDGGKAGRLAGQRPLHTGDETGRTGCGVCS